MANKAVVTKEATLNRAESKDLFDRSSFTVPTMRSEVQTAQLFDGANITIMSGEPTANALFLASSLRSSAKGTRTGEGKEGGRGGEWAYAG